MFKGIAKADVDNFLENQKLGSRFHMDAMLKTYKLDDMVEDKELNFKQVLTWFYTTLFETEVRRFSREVWFNGLQKIIKASRHHGITAHHEGFSFLTYSICGRTMITLQEGDIDDESYNSITLVADETSEEDRTGSNSFSCSINKAFELIDKACKLYLNGDLKFEEDEKVGMI